jgi:hypothetical protein
MLGIKEALDHRGRSAVVHSGRVVGVTLLLFSVLPHLPSLTPLFSPGVLDVLREDLIGSAGYFPVLNSSIGSFHTRPSC